jgi:succinate dehydrogenase / fumarate reductase, cytochrome b subunit
MTALAWVRSSIGKKALMALSGLALALFVLVHLAGNLLVFVGPDAMNAYALKLRHFGAWLWVARAGLILAALAHIWTSVALAIENRQARPRDYKRYRARTTSLAARFMLSTGVAFTAFLIYHLLHFTFRLTHPDISHGVDSLGRHDVYGMVVRSFQDPRVAFAYVVGVAALCVHLSHGIGSTFQTLGVNDERSLAVVSLTGRLASVAVFLGYSAIPLAAYLGYLR